MKIKIERSGGFAGLSSSNELDSDKLPLSLQDTVKELLTQKEQSVPKALRRPKGAADYHNYRITIQDGKHNHVLECNEIDIDNSVKSLVNYIQKYSLE